MKNKRRLATALSAVVLAFSTTAPAFAQSTADEAPAYASASRSAPADEYFGPLRLSVLGIRNSIAETTLRLDRVGLEVGDTMRNVGLVEASVRDWESKYPGDSWLPGIVLSLHRVYRRIGTQEAITHSIDVAMWLLQKYPDSDQAHVLRAELAGAIGQPDDQNVATSDSSAER